MTYAAGSVNVASVLDTALAFGLRWMKYPSRRKDDVLLSWGLLFPSNHITIAVHLTDGLVIAVGRDLANDSWGRCVAVGIGLQRCDVRREALVPSHWFRGKAGALRLAKMRRAPTKAQNSYA